MILSANNGVFLSMSQTISKLILLLVFSASFSTHAAMDQRSHDREWLSSISNFVDFQASDLFLNDQPRIASDSSQTNSSKAKRLVAQSASASSPASRATKKQPIIIPATSSHTKFFDELKKLCGKAFEGSVMVDYPKSEGFNDRLVMHVKTCTNKKIEVPFHVGNNRTRTWIITQTGSGLSLKHDHRQSDGATEDINMYGGHTINAGWAEVQEFPADEFTKELFIRGGIPQSIDNTWKLFLYPGKTFSYVLVRHGREFRIDFDLTKTVKP